MCRELWKYILAELEAECIITFAVLIWSLQVHDNVLCVLLVFLCRAMAMVTASLVAG